MRKLSILIIYILLNSSLFAQGRIDTLIYKYIPPDTTNYWNFNGNIGVNFQTVGFRDWAKGGKPSLSLASSVNMIAKYEKRGNIFENRIDAGYGIIREKDLKENTSELKKNDDYVILISKYGKNVFNDWYLEGILDTRTQFANGFKERKKGDSTYNELVSQFLSPITISPSLGLSYKNNDFSFSFSPVSGKLTIVAKDTLTYVASNGVEPGKNLKSQTGTTITLSDKRNVLKNILLRYSFTFFTAYNNFNFKHTDVNGEIYTRFKVNKYISSNFNIRLIYDDDFDPNDNGNFPLQLNYVLNVGFTYDIWQDG